MAEAEAGAEAARHWMRMKNAGRTLGKIPNPKLPPMFPPAGAKLDNGSNDKNPSKTGPSVSVFRDFL